MSKSRRTANSSQNRIRSSGQTSRSTQDEVVHDEQSAIIPFIPVAPPVTGCSSTPIKASSHFEQPPLLIRDMRPAVIAELDGSDVLFKGGIAKVYASYNDYPIDKFLSECALYDNDSKRWSALAALADSMDKAPGARKDDKANNADSTEESKEESAKGSTHEKVLYQPLQKIIHAIIEYFKDRMPSKPRIEETHKRRLTHVEDGIRIYKQDEEGNFITLSMKSSPDFAIMDTGGHLSSEQATSLDYKHCLAPLEVKTKATLPKFEARDQVAIYVRQCFIQQPHRRYVPTLVLTETHAYLRVYDRSGTISLESAINIHADAATFVRIALGICTITDNLESSALDPRIKWTTGEWPTITVAVPNELSLVSSSIDNSSASSSVDNPSASSPVDDPSASSLVDNPSASSSIVHNLIVYQVTGSPFVRRSIRGRGTVCWPAQQVEPTSKQGAVVKVLIKDSWRSANRGNELELLRAVKGLAGVGQMIAYEGNANDRISQFRSFIIQDLYSKLPYDLDRIFSRIVLEAYGRSIKHFKSKLELLQAFYDAVSGHKNMWLKSRILHRDISLDNILLGKENAEEGNRGILIDLDMAIKVDRETNLSESGQVRTGTRAYQSVVVLGGLQAMHPPFDTVVPPQDHLDDLESFFYVLSWICIKYDGPGKAIIVPALDSWEDPYALTCSNAKIAQLNTPFIHLQPYFSQDEVFVTLLVQLAQLCLQRYNKKMLIALARKPFPSLLDVYNSDTSSSGKDHDEFLAIIHTAISALERRGPEEVTVQSAMKGLSEDQAQRSLRTVGSATSEARDISTTSMAGQMKKRKNQTKFDDDDDCSQKRAKGSHSNSHSHRIIVTRSKSKSSRG